LNRLRFVTDSAGLDTSRMGCGVVFVIAFWSEYALRAFRKLTEVVAELDPQGRLEFVVVDADAYSTLRLGEPFPDGTTGAGEAVWIKTGRVVSSTGRGFNPTCFGPNTRAILSMNFDPSAS
jgi:hypothetical protein